MLRQSEALHARVRAFAAGQAGDTFEELALAIARFQRDHNPGYARLLSLAGSRLNHYEEIAPVPSSAFRSTRVAVHAAGADEVCFSTSGTTAGQRGYHPMRTTETYRQLSLCFGRQALLDGAREKRSVALMPPPKQPWTSSLAFMVNVFMREFSHGRGEHAGAWLLTADGIDVAGLKQQATLAASEGRALLIFSTAFALVHLLDQLAGTPLPLPAGSRVMYTGGFKGRTRSFSTAALRTLTAEAFCIDPLSIVGEYGMTELTSQLYEPLIAGSPLQSRVGTHLDCYVPPPWLRVDAVDPETLDPLPAGETGLARFMDLGNVDSAVAVVTEDLVRRQGSGIELLGRLPASPARGCSIAAAEYLGDGEQT